ncbi:hypothetical protein LZF95_15170 [Algoriphagus sp. AGSA1]|uniref:hypothetical protein n=1 Tax=Algoriphagus sp. AGSA1 TaxID=2907213 RepID=UPI001F2528C3|nr:hypothetical protein [Algoriphagus sp. AGSA1]MCE7056021.1 hypothetical protein [Algoriphagus sp. AGSA1]
MEILRTAILDMLRQRKGEGFTSAEVVKQMYPEDWKHFMPEINKETRLLSIEGLIKIEEPSVNNNSKEDIGDALRILPPNKLK